MATMTAKHVTVTQNKVTYKKINISDFDKGQLSMMCHRGRCNHVVWDIKNQKKLTDTKSLIRAAARRGDALVVGMDYFVRV